MGFIAPEVIRLRLFSSALDVLQTWSAAFLGRTSMIKQQKRP